MTSNYITRWFRAKEQIRRVVTVTLILTCSSILIYSLSSTNIQLSEASDMESIDWYAVFEATSPNNFVRDYDYIFNLPLTTLSWSRIGFKSVVLIIGNKTEWISDPLLSYVLDRLTELNATTIFIDSPVQHRMLLGQTARLFLASLPQFPGKACDYIITTDADLWPLRKAHYVPREGFKLVLVHSHCCGTFKFNSQSYRMVPMSNIGASAETWRQIMNYPVITANVSESIVQYFVKDFGPKVRNRVQHAKESWYYDQRMVSIRIDQWMKRNANQSVLEVSDQGFSRLDRIAWNIDKITETNFTTKYDSHLLNDGFLPDVWEKIRPLMHLMHGKDSWQSKWGDNYSKQFYAKMEQLQRI